ncbi:hypothetical protein GQR58_013961 [Nymphon striatum]|nr:hypothetical protein GQR58_013961 [Nymphon striatum]
MVEASIDSSDEDIFQNYAGKNGIKPYRFEPKRRRLNVDQHVCQFLKQKEKEKVKLTFEPERVKVRIPFKPDHFFTLYVVYSRALPSDTGYRLVLERTYSVPRIEHYKEGVIGRGGYARKCLKSRSDGYTSGSGGVFFILITT